MCSAFFSTKYLFCSPPSPFPFTTSLVTYLPHSFHILQLFQRDYMFCRYKRHKLQFLIFHTSNAWAISGTSAYVAFESSSWEVIGFGIIVWKWEPKLNLCAVSIFTLLWHKFIFAIKCNVGFFLHIFVYALQNLSHVRFEHVFLTVRQLIV